MCLMLYDDFLNGRYLCYIVCCVDANSGFSRSSIAATCPQVEPDVDHYVSMTHSSTPPFFAKGMAHDQCVRAVQLSSSA